MPKFMSVPRLLLVLLFGLQLSCSTLTEMTAEVPANWQKTLQHRSQVMSWKIQAKLGVQTEDNGGSFDLFWNQQGDAYQIRMIAPMGQGAILIRGDNRKVYVKTADGEEQYSNDVDAVLASRLGVNIPVAGLRDWLRGLPVKGEPVLVQKWDNRGQLAKLVQSDWNIDMSSYEKVAGYNLPHRFYFGRDDRPELGIRLLIRRWDLTGEALTRKK